MLRKRRRRRRKQVLRRLSDVVYRWQLRILTTERMLDSKRVKLTWVGEILGRMNFHERRIIHMAVAEEEGGTTESKGEGFMKGITILSQN